MKKTFTFLCLSLFSLSAFAATSGTLVLKAEVPKKVSIAIAPEAVASSLDLTVTQNDLKVGTLNERSNSRSGYKVKVTSQNQGKFKRIDGADVFPYTMKVSGTDMGLSTSGGVTFYLYEYQFSNTNRDMTISYTGKPAEQMVEGTYQDTVTFEISSI